MTAATALMLVTMSVIVSVIMAVTLAVIMAMAVVMIMSMLMAMSVIMIVVVSAAATALMLMLVMMGMCYITVFSMNNMHRNFSFHRIFGIQTSAELILRMAHLE